MKVINRLHTLLRAGVRESAERITDANAIRIYRQEIVDAEHLLERRRHRMAGLVAMRRDLEGEIAAASRRIANREQQVIAIVPAERTPELLMLAARDIATTEHHLAHLEQRRRGLVERIGREELALRNLVAEIREHRRELKILAAELADDVRGRGAGFGNTVVEQLRTLRATRAGIVNAVSGTDVAEDSMAEANERIDGDPLDRELLARGRDPESQRLAAVMERLQRLEGAVPKMDQERTEVESVTGPGSMN